MGNDYLFIVFRDGRRYKVMKVSLGKNKFAALGANLGYSNKKIANIQESQNKISFFKLKGAEQIYNRILWDKSLNHDEFTVGYEDRFLGTLELPFTEFSSKAEIPIQRIKLIKRNEETVWDFRGKVGKLN